MTTLPHLEPFAARLADPADRGEISDLAVAAGAHGVYLGNDLAADARGELLACRGLAFYGRERVLGLAWFGVRGNLVVVLAPEARLDVARLATAIVRSKLDWRIALGPRPLLDALAALQNHAPLVLREQVYYVAVSELVLAQPPSPAVRAAERDDVDALVAASLELNHRDLHLDPTRVSKRWLRDSTRDRVRDGTSLVIGPSGAPFAKLDLGSDGPFGVMVEGVFTKPEQRGRGYAGQLVHAAAHAALSRGRATVCLHVAADNLPARRSYERAGLRAADSVGLLLRSS